MTDKLSGSCLCGRVTYEIEGEAERFYYCHCTRCRKLTGNGNAGNLLMSPLGCITWTSGEHLLKRYDVPEAERFHSLFCRECGSPMPRPTPELDGVLVPAGSLDCEPPIRPRARIFWDSRAQWSEPDDSLPVHAEYP